MRRLRGRINGTPKQVIERERRTECELQKKKKGEKKNKKDKIKRDNLSRRSREREKGEGSWKVWEMGQIEKRKKKGRPSKADLARRSAAAAHPSSGATDSERRRSLRRRNVRYNNFIDFDDYLDEYDDYEEQQAEDEEEEEVPEPEEEEDDDEEEEEDERRKEKKLELVLKLHNDQSQSQNGNRRRGRPARASHARASPASSSDEDGDEGEGERKPLKKRRINGRGGGGESEAEEVDRSDGNDQGNDDEEEDDNDGHEEREADDKGLPDSVPGTPSDRLDSYPLPDKKVLDLVLHKLQKKDTYGVYSEPVDLEELPDYLDVVDHPMDFATVRKKLGNGSYSTLEQFESDVLLICSNAMKYNSSDTVYHKQARAIQELAHKKFEKLRVGIERSEKERKSEQKTKSNFSGKKQMKKPLSRAIQEPVGSDFSSGAALANAGEVQNGPNGVLAGACERPCNVDALVEGSLSLVDNNLEKLEELSSGKGPWPKIGKRLSVFDDNRRATYNICSQPVERPDTIFTTFEDELRQLVAVGLHAEYSYARSMARFAATLGPLAWKVAAHRIEQALPPGCKFGRGWVGEYEPVTTPVLMIETRSPRDNEVLLPKVKAVVDGLNGPDATAVPAAQPPPASGTTSQVKHTVFRPTCSVAEVKNSLFSSAATKPFAPVNVTHPRQTISPWNHAETQNRAPKQVELNLPPSNYQNDGEVGEKQLPKSSGMAPSKVWEAPSRTESPKPREVPPRTDSPKPREVPRRTESPKPTEVPRRTESPKSKEVPPRTDSPKPREVSRTEAGMPQSLPCKPLDSYEHVPPGFPNGRNTSSSLVNNGRSATASSDGFGQMGYIGRNQTGHGGLHYPPRAPGVVLTDPVEAMRISAAERAQKHQQPSSGGQSSVGEAPPASRSDNSNAAATAARAWMSIGAAGGGFKPPAADHSSSNTNGQISAESLYNPTWQLPPRMFQGQLPFPAAGVQQQFQQAEKNFPFQAFMRPPPFPGGGEGQVQGGRPIMFSPQLVAADLSRLQMMSSPWRGQTGLPSESQPTTRQKQETHTLSPDLNIGFQSPGSPAKQSSGVMVDSQQPDLALQL
ncbi:unnamed protein product [Linum tenue]|uniref:Bromo domain-containing protein n=1 Tax=Linum tenue TaxID=586396 RepID=A0AAV0LUR4_9ROSI|nr:unnamed protein product [Linum tenue]